MPASKTMGVRVKLQGGALYYAILVALICSFICASLLLYSHLNSTEWLRLDEMQLVTNNCHSGLELLLSEAPPLRGNDSLQYDLDENNHIILKQEKWGLHTLIFSDASLGKVRLKKAAILGQLPTGERPALFLKDKNRPLSICGDTRLKGTCYLPAAGVKRAYIEGKTFKGDQLVDGERKQIPKDFPKFKEAILVSIDSLRSLRANAEVLLSSLTDSTDHSFWRQAELIVADLELSGVHLRGKRVVFSDEPVIISGIRMLEDAIIIAPTITILKDAICSGQFIASDSITVEKGATIEYPSALIVYGELQSLPGNISIEQDANVKGVAVLFNREQQQQLRSRSQLLIEKGARVHGLVYTNAAIQLKGSVFGTIYTHSFYLQTMSSIYENHLLDATIDATALDKDFADLLWMDGSTHKCIAKWVY